jgi:hypothetical protein
VLAVSPGVATAWIKRVALAPGRRRVRQESASGGVRLRRVTPQASMSGRTSSTSPRIGRNRPAFTWSRSERPRTAREEQLRGRGARWPVGTAREPPHLRSLKAVTAHAIAQTSSQRPGGAQSPRAAPSRLLLDGGARCERLTRAAHRAHRAPRRGHHAAHGEPADGGPRPLV